MPRLDKLPKVSIRLSENKILEIMSQTTYEFATKYKKFKYSVEDNFTLFCKSYQKPRDMKSKENLRNKHMFRYTSGIGQI